jgi:hypothetical protein
MSDDPLPSKVRLVEAALADLKRGYYSVPLVSRTKRPTGSGWPELRLTEPQLNTVFEDGHNRGRLLGVAMSSKSTLSGYSTCVDLDVSEALELAPLFLPETEDVSGREATPASHWFYISDVPVKTRRFSGPDKTRYLELLGLRTQVVVAPSIHPSGDVYTEIQSGDTRNVTAESLLSAVRELAVATLCMKHCHPDMVAPLLSNANAPGICANRIIKILATKDWSPASHMSLDLLSVSMLPWFPEASSPFQLNPE